MRELVVFVMRSLDHGSWIYMTRFEYSSRSAFSAMFGGNMAGFECVSYMTESISPGEVAV